MLIRTTRRTLIRGAAATATVTGPFLRLLARPARAAAPVKRLVVFATQNGMNPTLFPLWWPGPPSATDDAKGAAPLEAKYGRITKVLQPLMPKLVFMRGLDMKSADKDPVPPNHGPDFPNALTGVQAPAEGQIGAISVDQHIANAIGGKTKFSSLQLGVEADGVLFATGAQRPLAYENSPRKLFDRLFKDLVPGAGAVESDPAALERLRADRMSVLDAVRQDLNDVRCQLGAVEARKFDAHLQAVRELEKNLSFDGAGPGGSCQVPPAPTAGDFPTTARRQMDLLAMILACDLTRVVGFKLAHYQTVFSWLGISEPDHSLAHYAGMGWTREQGHAALIKIETWYAEQFAYLCNKLDGILDGDGTLLDNTATLWLHEQSDGLIHSRRDMPYVLAGSCAGVFRTGQVLSFGGAAHSGLLISLANAMDVPTAAFGDPDFSKGPLTGL